MAVGESEFGGRDTASGVRAAPEAALMAWEKLRLTYRSGDLNVDAPDDPARHNWNGTDKARFERPDLVEAKKKGW